MSIRQALLTLLEDEPRYGYQLRAEFEARTGGTWPLNVGQVYTTLTRLERDGLVEAAGSDDEGHAFYALTDKGRDEVRRWFGTPVDRERPPRDELAIKLALAVTVPGVDVRAVIQAQRTDTVRALQEYIRLKSRASDELAIKLALAVTVPGVDVRAVIQAQRTDTVRALQEYIRLKSRASDTDLAWVLVLDALMFQAEAEVRWLDHCESRLARHRPPPGVAATRAPMRTKGAVR